MFGGLKVWKGSFGVCGGGVLGCVVCGYVRCGLSGVSKGCVWVRERKMGCAVEARVTFEEELGCGRDGLG